MADRLRAWVFGTGGIGTALLERLAHHHEVVGFDRCERPTGGPSFQVNATDRAALAIAAHDAAGSHGMPDIFIITVGLVSPATVESATPDELTAVLSDNLMAPINVLHMAYHLGPPRPRTCVVVASNAAFVPRPGQPIYAAAKAAVVSLVRSLAVAWSTTGIRIFGVTPGTVVVPRNSDRIKRQYPQAPLDSGRPGGQLLVPSELANIIVKLLPHADHLTGQLITLDGGSTVMGAP